jgi:hypothetical protein
LQNARAFSFLLHSLWIHTMLRCATSRRNLLSLAAALTLCAAGPAQAQLVRKFPSNALRGVIIFTQPPNVLLNGDPARLAPGVRIHGSDNMSKLPGSQTDTDKVTVNYTIEGTSGAIKEIWILRPDEASNKPWPRTLKESRTWTFNASAQTWTKP